MKLHLKKKARMLRSEGKSYNEILREIPVSKSTINAWVKDIELTATQKKRLYVTIKQKNADRLGKLKKLKKNQDKQETLLLSEKEYDQKHNEILFNCGIMLYWAEGDKSTDNEMVKFSNSDPDMIKFMMRWFREICLVPEEKIRIALHIHELHNKKYLERTWSQITKIPLTQFNKTQIKKSTLKFKKKPLYQGTCSIRIYNRNLFRKILHWKNIFLAKQA